MRTLTLALSFTILAQVAPRAAADVAETAGMTALAETLSSVGAADAAFIRRLKLRKKRVAGYRVVATVGDDIDNNVANVDATIVHAAGEPAPIGGTTACDDQGNCETNVTLGLKVVKPNGTKRFVFNELDLDDIPPNYSYSMRATMKDAAGQQIGPEFVATVTVEAPGDTRVRSVTARQIDATNFRFKVVVVDDLDDEIEQVFVTFDDYTGPDPEPDDSFVLAEPTIKADGKKVFKNNALMFSDPVAVVDEVYSVIIDLRDADGVNSLGSSYHQVVVEGLEDGGGVNQCADGVRNGQETAIDCGGGVCPACGAEELQATLELERAQRAAVDAAVVAALIQLEQGLAERDVAIADLLGVSVEELHNVVPPTTTLLTSGTYDNFVLTAGGVW